MPKKTLKSEDWNIHANWHRSVETLSDSIRRLQRFVVALTEVAPIFGELLVSPGEERFSQYSQRRLVNVLKRNPIRESEIRSNPSVSYRIQLVVPPHQGEQSHIHLSARFCRKANDNSLSLNLGDISRSMFAPMSTSDWVAIFEQLVTIFEPRMATMRSGKFWEDYDLRPIGWANYVSREAVTALPTQPFPAVIPLRDQGAIYLCSRNFTGQTTKETLTAARKLKAAIDAVQKKY